jgi:hypothetical protein
MRIADCGIKKAERISGFGFLAFANLAHFTALEALYTL